MPAEHHKKASQSFKNAAKFHDEASEHYSKGNHEKGAHAAHTARGHELEGNESSAHASRKHASSSGNK